MDFHFNLFSLLLLFSGMTALLISLVLFQRLQQRSILWFALMMLGSAFWAIFYSLELSSNSLDEMLFWVNYEYIGIGSIPALWDSVCGALYRKGGMAEHQKPPCNIFLSCRGACFGMDQSMASHSLCVYNSG